MCFYHLTKNRQSLCLKSLLWFTPSAVFLHRYPQYIFSIKLFKTCTLPALCMVVNDFSWNAPFGQVLLKSDLVFFPCKAQQKKESVLICSQWLNFSKWLYGSYLYNLSKKISILIKKAASNVRKRRINDYHNTQIDLLLDANSHVS